MGSGEVGDGVCTMRRTARSSRFPMGIHCHLQNDFRTLVPTGPTAYMFQCRTHHLLRGWSTVMCSKVFRTSEHVGAPGIATRSKDAGPVCAEASHFPGYKRVVINERLLITVVHTIIDQSQKSGVVSFLVHERTMASTFDHP